MDPEFIIETVRERRVGIDMVAMPYIRETVFAEPDCLKEDVGDTSSGGCQIPSTGG